MDFKTALVYQTYLRRRKHAIARYATRAEEIQRHVLERLLHKAHDTEWGQRYSYTNLTCYEDYAQAVPVNDYDSLKGDIRRMREGEKSILWPGKVRWYAKSSGTTNDKSKFIPVSSDGLRHIHYAGGTDSVAFHLEQYPDSHLFSGKNLILGGSHAPNLNTPNSLVGDLSAILIENIPNVVERVRVPSKKVALMEDFEKKRDLLAHEAITADVRSLSGVPSWMLSVLSRVLEISGKSTLDTVWPHLEIFWHGGVAFTPYKEQYQHIITLPNMHYMETYNASEGFFGLQNDPTDAALMLMIDYGVFYEFIPMSQFGTPDAHPIPLWKVETDVNYAMVISTNCGLWRYVIGDTVRFTQKNPYKFIITGRTKQFINAFGEELIVDNTEKALQQACLATGAEVREYTAAPIFMNEHAKCRHQWLIEFARKPSDINEFALILDRSLQAINSDYEAKRHADVTLQSLQIIEAKTGLFDEWLRSKGKLGGQHKIPRLSNSRQYLDEMLQLNV